jgi:hypothetical protein
MDGQTSDIIWMGFKGRNLFVGVVVENTQLEVVGTSHEPVLPGNKLDAANWNLGNFEGLDQSTCFVVVNVDTSVVQTR